MSIRKVVVFIVVAIAAIFLYIIISTMVQSYMANQVYEKTYKVK